MRSIPVNPPRKGPCAFAASMVLWAVTAHGQATDGESDEAQVPTAARPQSNRVEITGRHYDNAVGTSDAASQGTIRAELLKSRPPQRPGEVLEFVPA